uniref:Bro-N domain-containing protein n=1 Tax=Drosophila-associated filamentous virus TaxID=2743186 RepID=A0A6M9U011_9VIRU|nr:putative protein 30 [Drosophila-associated filamentous virus]
MSRMSLTRRTYNLCGITYELYVYTAQDNIPWFKAKEIAILLGYTDVRRSYQNIEDADKRQWSDLYNNDPGFAVPRNWQPTTIFINENGLYQLMLRCRRPEAEQFRQWITSEILPTIRQNGCYMQQAPPPLPSSASSSSTAVVPMTREMEFLQNVNSQCLSVLKKLNDSMHVKNQQITNLIEHHIYMMKARDDKIQHLYSMVGGVNEKLDKFLLEKTKKVSSSSSSNAGKHICKIFINREINEYKIIKTRKVSLKKALMGVPYQFVEKITTNFDVPENFNLKRVLSAILSSKHIPYVWKYNNIKTNGNLLDIICRLFDNEGIMYQIV